MKCWEWLVFHFSNPRAGRLLRSRPARGWETHCPPIPSTSYWATFISSLRDRLSAKYFATPRLGFVVRASSCARELTMMSQKQGMPTLRCAKAWHPVAVRIHKRQENSLWRNWLPVLIVESKFHRRREHVQPVVVRRKLQRIQAGRVIGRTFTLLGMILFGAVAFQQWGSALAVQYALGAAICAVIFIVLLIKR